MPLLRKLIRRMTGLHYPQEYLCLPKESSVDSGLRVYLVEAGKPIRDITTDHGFLGYHPLIFAIPFQREPLPENLTLVFSHPSLPLNVKFRPKDALATLTLKLFRSRMIDNNPLGYYEGMNGSHRFLSSFHQSIINLYNRLYQRQPGNIFLKGNLYTQVQIAYSLPRMISVVTVGENGMYNLFPTDLHGCLNGSYYLDSLRLEGCALQQVENSKRILLSEVNFQQYKEVYRLGRNHMQPLKPMAAFPFGPSRSELFQFPLPLGVLRYRELELLDGFSQGIHKILLFRIVSYHELSPDLGTLSHVHNSFATWQYNKGLAGNYLLR